MNRTSSTWLFCRAFALAVGFVFCSRHIGGAADAQEETAPVSLRGSVWDDESNAITNATVLIYTAKPRKGVGSVCSSCYPDCQKQARTDSEGNFKIDQVDGSLLFDLLVIAKGFESTFVDKIDLAHGPIEVGLRKEETERPAAGQIQGRIVDPKGKPVLGAEIQSESVTVQEQTRWGRVRGAEQLLFRTRMANSPSGQWSRSIP